MQTTTPRDDRSRLMLRRITRIATGALVDAAVVVASYLITIALLTVSDPDYESFNADFVLLLLIALCMVASLYAFGVYKRLWHRTSGYGVTIIINAVVVATVAIIFGILLLAPNALAIQLILFGNSFSMVIFVALRYRSRLISGLSWRWNAVIRSEFPHSTTHVLIIGAGESGQVLALRLKHRYRSAHNRYKVVGFIDDDLSKQGLYVESCPIIGTRHDIVKLAEKHKIDLIVVAIHNISGPSFREILTYCEKTKALIKVVPDLQEMVNARQTTDVLRDVQAEDLIGRSPVTRYEGVDLSPVTEKTILITGAAGSIGSELSRQIMAYRPTKVVILDNNESGLHDLFIELQSKHPELNIFAALVDITIRPVLRTIFETHQPQIVFHAAAYKHVPMLENYPHEAIRVNVVGTRNLAELAQEYNVERFVLISTDKAVNPSSVMGASKRLCELILLALSQNKSKNTRFAAVRFGNVLGSRGSVVPTFNRQIDSGGPVTVTHQEMTRYFMSIPEAVNLIIHAACMTNGHDIYVLQMGEVVRIVELAERMIRLRGLRPYQDIEIKFTGIRPGEKMHEELFNEIEKPGETQHPNIMKVDNDKSSMMVDHFWSKIDTLMEESFAMGSTALHKMTVIIQDEPSPSLNGHHGEPIPSEIQFRTP